MTNHKAATLRYAHDQGFSPKYVSYAFELEPGEYDVTVCMNNTWGNATNPTVTLAADGVEDVAQVYNLNAQRTHTMAVDLTGAEVNSRGYVELSVKATTTVDDTIQMSYITIVRTDLEPEEPEEIPVTGVTLDQTTAFLKVGETLTLEATVVPETATDKSVTWSSDNTDVATVENGVVTAVAAGKAKITVTAANGKTAACTVTVTESPAPEETYKVTVYNAYSAQSGSGDYKEGDTVAIHAGSRSGYRFAGWHTDDVALPDAASADTTFTMPGRDVLVEALWSKITTPGNSHVTPEKSEEVPQVPVQTPFYDVKSTDWYAKAAAYVAENGYMNGVAEGRFDPDGSVTRAMVWTVLARMDGVNTEGGSTWYTNAQQWAVETGVSDGTDPMGSISREQLAAMLYRFEGSPAVNGNLNAYPDANTVSDWACDAMAWATETGLINGINGQLSPKTGATRAQLATMLMRMLES